MKFLAWHQGHLLLLPWRTSQDGSHTISSPVAKNCRQLLTLTQISPRTCLLLRQWFCTRAERRLRLKENLFSIQFDWNKFIAIFYKHMHNKLTPMIQLNIVIQWAYTSILWNLRFRPIRASGGFPNVLSSWYSCVVQSNNKTDVEWYQPWTDFIFK